MLFRSGIKVEVEFILGACFCLAQDEFVGFIVVLVLHIGFVKKDDFGFLHGKYLSF